MDDEIYSPILQISEFELEKAAILDAAKKDTARIIQEARHKAEEIVQKEKQNFPNLEKECAQRTLEDLKSEKERLVLSNKEELGHIHSITSKRLKQIADCLVEKILPKYE